MSTNTTSTSMLDSIAAFQEHCPRVGRRTTRELYVKFFVVNLTVIAAYMHLLSARNEGGMVVRALTLFLTPIGAVWHLGIVVIAVPLKFITSRGDLQLTKETFALLCGRMHDDDPDLPSWRMEKAEPPRRRLRMPQLPRRGRVGLLAGVFAQSALSIYMFTRRRTAGALSEVDYAVLHVAIAGMCITILNVLQLVFDPRCPQQRIKTKNWGIEFVREPESHWYSGMHDLVFTAAATGAVYIAMDPRARIGALLSTLPTVSTQGDAAFSLTQVASVLIWFWVLLMLLVGAGVGVLAVWRAFYPSKGSAKDQLWEHLRTLGMVTAVWWMMSGAILVLLAPLKYMTQMSSVFTTMSYFDLLAPQQPCPQAWRDPMEHLVWWLA